MSDLRSRFTNDEVDDLILSILEDERPYGLPFHRIRRRISCMKNILPLDPDYEHRQLRRRMQWLAKHGFIYADSGLYWYLVQ